MERLEKAESANDFMALEAESDKSTIRRLQATLEYEREKSEADDFMQGLSEGYGYLNKVRLVDALAEYKQRCERLSLELDSVRAHLRNAEKGNARLSKEIKELTRLQTNAESGII